MLHLQRGRYVVILVRNYVVILVRKRACLSSVVICGNPGTMFFSSVTELLPGQHRDPRPEAV